MTLQDIQNEYSLNIFTDASIKNVGKGYVGCYGAAAVIGTSIKEESMWVIDNTTNNNSEIKAIREGIYLALKYGNGKIINLFSDSQISVFGLRNRIFNWKFHNGSYYGSAGSEIANQEIFSEVADMIVQYNIPIRLWHQAGHVLFTERSLKDAAHVFRTSNGIRGVLDMNLIRYISTYNNMVDRDTRNHLYKGMHHRDNVKVCTNPIFFYPKEINKTAYRSLLTAPNMERFVKTN